MPLNDYVGIGTTVYMCSISLENIYDNEKKTASGN